MANQFKLIIFGEEWTVLLSDVDQHPILGEVSGYTDWTVKQIIIKDARKYQSKMDMDDQRAFMKSTLTAYPRQVPRISQESATTSCP